MIRYCLSAILLVACTGTGGLRDVAPDPVPVIVLPEIEIRAPRIVEPEHLKTKPIRRAAVPRRAPCGDSNESTKEEFLAKLECVKKLTERNDA